MSSSDIKQLCLDISELVLQYGHPDLADTFAGFASEIDEGTWDTVKREFISLYNGGTGSFNDLTLYKDGRIQAAATNELNKLRIQLYELVTSNW